MPPRHRSQHQELGVSGAAICAGVSLSCLLDQCSRDINCITAHYEGGGGGGGRAARCHPITIYTAQLWHGGVKTAG